MRLTWDTHTTAHGIHSSDPAPYLSGRAFTVFFVAERPSLKSIQPSAARSCAASDSSAPPRSMLPSGRWTGTSSGWSPVRAHRPHQGLDPPPSPSIGVFQHHPTSKLHFAGPAQRGAENFMVETFGGWLAHFGVRSVPQHPFRPCVTKYL